MDDRTYLAIDRVLPILIIPCIAVKPRALEKGKLGPIGQQETIAPFWTCVFFNIVLGRFLLTSFRKVDSIIVVWEEGNDNTIRTFLNSTNRNAGPLRSVFRRRSITIVTSTEEKNTKLQMGGELGTVRIVVKDGVINDEFNETVKSLGLNTQLVTKALPAMNPPVVKEVELWWFRHRRGL
jgi:hypothetical protein